MDQPGSVNKKPFPYEWALLMSLFLFMRLGALAFFHPSWSSLFPLEEYYRGVLGRELLQGLSMPYWAYRPDNYCGGSLVMGILAAGFFKLFGSSAFVLKLIPVLISLGALLIWFGILYREFSRKCAWYFSLFFIFSPAVFQCYSLVPLGDHYETIFISALAVWIFLKVIGKNREEGGRTGKNKETDSIQRFPSSSLFFLLLPSFSLGLVCGFGVWFAYIFALTLMAILIVWGLGNPKFIASKSWGMFAGGFLIGFSPWVFIGAAAGFPGLDFNGIPLQNFLHVSSWNWRSFFLCDLSGLFWPPSGRTYAGYFEIGSLYALLLILPGAGALLVRLSQGQGLPFSSSKISLTTGFFLIYAFLHCAALQLTRFEGERYVTPLMPVIFFFWARTLEYLESVSRMFQKVVRIFFAAPLLGLGAFLWLSMISPVYAGYLLRTPGYAYDYLANVPVCAPWEICRGIHEKMMTGKSEEDQRDLWISLAIRTASEWVDRDDAPPEHLFLNPDFSGAFYFHSGKTLFAVNDSAYLKTAEVLESLWKENSPPLQLGLLGAAYDFGNYPLYEKFNQLKARTDEFSWLALRGFFRSSGFQYIKHWRQRGVTLQALYPMASAYIKDENPEVRESFFEGIGYYFTRYRGDIPLGRSSELETVRTLFSGSDQEAFYYGAGLGAQVSSSFFPQRYERWICEWTDKEIDLTVLSWIQKGRQEVIETLDALHQGRATPDRFLVA